MNRIAESGELTDALLSVQLPWVFSPPIITMPST